MFAGSLIKLVYFSRHEDHSVNDKRKKTVKERLGISNGNRRSYPILGGRLHFVKFETNKINECLDFISSKQLHRAGIFKTISFNVCACVFIYNSKVTRLDQTNLLFQSIHNISLFLMFFLSFFLFPLLIFWLTCGYRTEFTLASRVSSQ